MASIGVQDRIVFQNVSKFYGEVLGINRVNLSIPAGITSLVGPNGSGKTTLLNLMTGLLQPSQGSISVLGISPTEPGQLFRRAGYCSQFDSFPRRLTGYQFIYGFLRIHGFGHPKADELTWQSLRQVKLEEAARRKVAGYSKGMRQRVKLAQAIAHQPDILILDEPLNGLDPLARAEMISLFQQLASSGLHVVISSHILHEVDLISDQVVLLDSGYVVAEGAIRGVRDEVKEHPAQILVRCDRPSQVAARLFQEDHIVEASLHEDQRGLLIRTRDSNRFYACLNRVVLEDQVQIETVAPADEDVESVYQYLIGQNGGAA